MKLDDLIRDAKNDKDDIASGVDWKSVDEKLFARIEQEPRPLSTKEATKDEAPDILHHDANLWAVCHLLVASDRHRFRDQVNREREVPVLVDRQASLRVHVI